MAFRANTLQVITDYQEYVMVGGIEGIDIKLEAEYWEREPHVPDEDGEIAYERMMDDWATRENCPEWAR